MRRLSLLLVLALALAACGGSGAPKDAVKIKFGRIGGFIVSYTVTIAPGGAVTKTGVVTPAPLSSSEDARISALVRDGLGKLKSLQCGRTPPDVAELFITAMGKTVAVRGGCEAGFTKLFVALANATHVSS